jgi:hypothetical protein
MRDFGYRVLGLLMLLWLSACTQAPKEVIKTVYVPVMITPPPKPSSLTPQPIMLFNMTKQGRKLFVLNEEFPYCDQATGKVIVVPRWYVTDFASVPWFGQAVIDPQGPTARAAIIHDWLYTIGEKGKREEADAIFYRAMKAFGVNDFQAGIAYNAVRTGGESGYGLASDWMFIDPDKPSLKQNPGFTRPSSGIARIMPGCRGFIALVASGWKAYPVKSEFNLTPAIGGVSEMPLTP